ncbi:MAG TPA: divergent polysaccharide deacetylase family protein [Sulfurovum sp.]|nr:divergent polysaccharide deacetylase family protein [Sulfurovum sp.]
MAAQPKKTKTSSSQNSARKRGRKKTTNTSSFKKSILTVLGVLLMIVMVVFGYFLGRHAKANDHTPIAQTYKTDEADSRLKLFEELSKKEAEKREQTEITKAANKPISQYKRKDEKVVKKDAAAEVRVKKKARLTERGGRPKLAIIIDDVSTRSQLDRIKTTGIPITPSIFPPSKLSMSSHMLAAELHHYMIHLPMESGSTQFNGQSKTLTTHSTKEEIETRVKELRKLFPHARYINNHTGSVFTDDHEAMEKLYRALRKEGFLFVDSRTIGSTKVPQIAKAFGDAYVARDVFIDNVQSLPYIHKQLEKAVSIAKKKGHAIAIGHPHKMTMEALSSAKEIFQDVDLVYIDELYR